MSHQRRDCAEGAAADWRDELERLLTEPLEEARARARNAFDRLAGDAAERIVLLGAGNLGRKVLRGLREEGIEPLAFSDNAKHLWGQSIDGVLVLSPTDAARIHGGNAVFVLAIWRGETDESMADRIAAFKCLGCLCVVHFGYLFWKYPQRFLPHYALDLPEQVLAAAGVIRAAFELLADEASQRAFVGHVDWRLHLDFTRLPLPDSGPIYFRDELFRLGPDEVFADCGAFDGDTLEQFIAKTQGQFRHVYCFEADPQSAGRLEQRRERLESGLGARVSVLPQAVGAHNGTIHLDALGTVSSAVCAEGGIEIQCVTLDAALAGAGVSLIKMDVEGYEAAALAGAAQCIRENRPVMAICIYHQQDHLWSLPLLLAELGDGYRFYLRAHVHDGWDLVCYAVPEDRLRESD